MRETRGGHFPPYNFRQILRHPTRYNSRHPNFSFLQNPRWLSFFPAEIDNFWSKRSMFSSDTKSFNNSPILRKKMGKFREKTTFSRNFLAIFPSVAVTTTHFNNSKAANQDIFCKNHEGFFKFCQNARKYFLRPCWQKYSHFDKIWRKMLVFFSWLLSV